MLAACGGLLHYVGLFWDFYKTESEVSVIALRTCLHLSAHLRRANPRLHWLASNRTDRSRHRSCVKPLSPSRHRSKLNLTSRRGKIQIRNTLCVPGGELGGGMGKEATASKWRICGIIRHSTSALAGIYESGDCHEFSEHFDTKSM